MSGSVQASRKVGRIATGTLTGPSSYSAASGISLDLSGLFASIDFFDAIITNISTLGVHHLRHTIAGSVVTLRVFQEQYDAVSSIGNASGQPSGVTLAAASGQTVSNESAHTHPNDHDHIQIASAGPTAAGAGVETVGGTVNETTHTHLVDVPLFTGSTGAGSAHGHTDNNIQAHDHATTFAETDCAGTELANGSNIVSVTWRWLTIGTLA